MGEQEVEALVLADVDEPARLEEAHDGGAGGRERRTRTGCGARPGPRSRAPCRPSAGSFGSSTCGGSSMGSGLPLVATYSLVACDLEQGEWGVGVQSKFLAVGSVVPWAAADVGAVATQALANVAYGPDGLELLRSGLSAEDVVARLTEADDGRDDRQLGVVDPRRARGDVHGAGLSRLGGREDGPGVRDAGEHPRVRGDRGRARERLRGERAAARGAASGGLAAAQLAEGTGAASSRRRSWSSGARAATAG